MVSKKPKIVIVGAGMAGLVAAHKLYRASTKVSEQLFDLCVVEGGDRTGGRINTSEFGGNLIEMGATWIHGIGGSPVHEIAQEIGALDSEKPWERMDGFPEDSLTVLEDGSVIDPSIVDPISNLYRNLMEFAKGKKPCSKSPPIADINGGLKALSIGAFLRRGLEEYWAQRKNGEEVNGCCNLSRKIGEEAVFAMNENVERTYTGAGDLFNLDFKSEHEYQEFPGEEITIAKGYSSIIESLASVLPPGLICLGKKVVKIEWCPEQISVVVGGGGVKSDLFRPVKLHFEDGSAMEADHVIVTVSLGVLKSGIKEEQGMFSPPLPNFKTQAISRLGFGVVNKLFLQLGRNPVFPSLQMAFHQNDYCRDESIPWWLRRTASLLPIYNNSSVVLAWFAGQEAVELESLEDEEIIDGVSTTISKFLPNSQTDEIQDGHRCNNGGLNSNGFKITGVVRSRWASNPLFMGSYSYVAVGSSGDDLDSMAKPLPMSSKDGSPSAPPLQILFAGEATHRTHYSTTHGAYYSGVREANRLLQHYNCAVSSELLHH